MRKIFSEIFMSTTRGIIYFRFKHQTTLDKIEFAASEITVAELRIKINERLLLTDHQNSSYKNQSVLQICKIGAYGEAAAVYDSDFELIPTNTTVLVLRVPTGKTAGKKIVVEQQDLFATAQEGMPDPLALKASIIQEEIDKTSRRVPEFLVCPICRWFLLKDAGHGPVTLVCCGSTVCSACAMGSTCPVEQIDKGARFKAVANKAIERIVEIVVKNRDLFAFTKVVTPEGFLEVTEDMADDTAAVDVEVLDVDEFEPEVFDVDNPRPLTAKEKEQLERRERRKRKAIEILMKREGKLVKGELTEADVNKLLKTEQVVKDELGMLDGSIPGHAVDGANENGGRAVVIEFPRLLSPEEFALWQRQ